MKTQEILDQIGDVLDDWEVSPDAMRCNAQEPARGASPRLTLIDESHFLVQPPDAPAWAPDPFWGRVLVGWDRSWSGGRRPLVVDWRDPAPRSDLRPFIEAMDQAVALLSAMGESRAWKRAVHWTAHHPVPLSIDGHAYRRRQRNRRRR